MTYKIALPEFLKLDFINDLQLGKKRQEGGSGSVFEGELLNSRACKKYKCTKVAVKIFKGMSKVLPLNYNLLDINVKYWRCQFVVRGGESTQLFTRSFNIGKC
jgi:hypothetical protein